MIFGASLSVSATTVEGACGDTYNYDTNKYDNVTWSLNTETGVMTVSGKGKMGYWNWGEAPWYSYRSQIRSVVIEEGVTHISDNSFTNHSAMTEISIPASLTTIGASYGSIFENCKALTSVYITDLAAWCQIDFKDNLSNPLCHAEVLYLNGVPMTELTIPNSVTVLKKHVFYNFKTLTKVTLPNNLTLIEKSAFTNCTELTDINIPNSVRTIESEAFSNCTKLIEIVDGISYVDNWMITCSAVNTEAVLREGTVGIADSAFSFSRNVKKLHIPSSLKIIEKNETFTIVGVYITDLAAWCDIDFYDASSNPLSYNSVLYVNDSHITHLELPQGITSINKYAFDYCGGLISVKIPNSVVSIGDNAFSNCPNLTTVELSGSVTAIGNSAFKNCSALTSIDLPFGIVSVGDEVFYSCSALESISIPKSLSSIGKRAFYDCNKLTSVYLTDLEAWCGVTLHDRYASPALNGAQFYLNGELITQLVIPNGIMTISDYAFYCVQSITSVTLPDSLTSIGNCAFSYCNKLKSIVLPKDLTFIGNNAFSDCTALESVSVPKSVTNIGEYAFSYCGNIKSLVFCGTSQQWTSITKGKNWIANEKNFNLSYHAWSTGSTTEEHTESVVGKITYTCSACGETKDEPIGHSYGNWSQNDETTHEKACACGSVQQSNHTYSNVADTVCNDCGYVRTIATPPATDKKPSEETSTDTQKAGTESSKTETTKPQAQVSEESTANNVSEKPSGCGSSITSCFSIILLCMGSALVLFKKKVDS
jgi:hypothetical protein